MSRHAPRLIADIGGTNARFSLIDPADGQARRTQVLRCHDYPGLAEAALAYLANAAPAIPPAAAAFAVACPVLDDRVTMTNLDWTFSIAELKARLKLDRLEVVNDFIALALSVPHLTAEHKAPVGGGTATAGAPIAVIGPGTGLGVAGLVPVEKDWMALATEGGHVTMSAADEPEAAALSWLRDRHGHVSAERVLSGPGLLNLYQALGALRGRPSPLGSPHEITTAAQDGDVQALEALHMFFSMLGTVAGNLALTLGARGGVMIGGGIVPALLPALLASDFRRRFDDKGRFSPYLKAIPVHVITHPYPALLGLASLAD